MNKLEQAARQALEALEAGGNWYVRQQIAITALREALDHSADTGNKVSDHIAASGKMVAEPVKLSNSDNSPNNAIKQEPVAWHEPGSYGNVTTHKIWAMKNGWLPLYPKEQE